jgi:transcriptional regulator with XRE-family HTH domain
VSTVFTKRLKEARLKAGLSQERLGVLAGIDEYSASARMNQYERGKHAPDWLMVERLAAALGVPVAYFYAADDDAAALLLAFHALTPQGRAQVVEMVRALL